MRLCDVADDFGAWLCGIIWALPERIDQTADAVRRARRAVRATAFRFLAWLLGPPIAYSVMSPPAPPAPTAPEPRRSKRHRDDVTRPGATPATSTARPPESPGDGPQTAIRDS